ncbi:putative methyltransferase-domain-containing protein [Phellopilus nigrolimitatus]|nr:putative methyltransferase-domain-containing protein [Phellopilus nigrolimitatus]
MQGQLFTLLQSYASLVPLSKLEWPSQNSNHDIQNVLIDHLVSSDHFRSYPPDANYQRSFWKWTIRNIEEQGYEVDESIYAHYLPLLSTSLSTAQTVSFAQPPPPSFVTYIWNDPLQYVSKLSNSRLDQYNKCTLFEARTTIESGTTGLRTWTASFILAEYLITHRDLVEASRVLELGCGAGFLGNVVAQLQNEYLSLENEAPKNELVSLYLTDLTDHVLARCESNISLPCNNLRSHPRVRFSLLDWSHALDVDRLPGLLDLLDEMKADVVLGADLVYDARIIPSLVAVLKLALEPRFLSAAESERKAIIAATRRNEATLSEFVRQSQDAGLKVREEEVIQYGLFSTFSYNQPDRSSEEDVRVTLFTITCKTVI